MPKKRLAHDARRQQIIETTLLCLGRDGADGTSLRSVCRELDVAPSLVTHFFDGWHDLLTAAYALLTERFMAHLSPVLTSSFPTERARMDALILRYLSTDWAGENTIGANLALWQLARSVVDLKPHFSRFLHNRTQLLHRTLAALAAEAGTKIEIGQMTACFILMLDGVWLEVSLNPGNLRQSEATRMCWFWLDSVLRPPASLRVARPVRRAIRSSPVPA